MSKVIARATRERDEKCQGVEKIQRERYKERMVEIPKKLIEKKWKIEQGKNRTRDVLL